MASYFSRVGSLVDSVLTSLVPRTTEGELTSSSDLYESGSSDILWVGFNQNYTCVSVGTGAGFKIFQCKPFSLAFVGESEGKDARQVSMLFGTSLLALVGGDSWGSSPRTVRLFNTKSRKEILSVACKGTVLGVKMNSSRLCIRLHKTIHIFKLKTMKRIHEIEVQPSPTGAFDLCTDEDNCLLAFPKKRTPETLSSTEKECLGTVGILDAHNLQMRSIIRAHDNAIQCLALNVEGNLLATASTLGTVVRVWAVPSGKHLFTFRRGTRPTLIQWMAFNPTSALLLCTSNTETVHIFNLIQAQANQQRILMQHSPASTSFMSDSTLYDQMTSLTSVGMEYASEYLPTQLRNQIEQPRSFAQIKVKRELLEGPKKGLKCGFDGERSIVLISEKGYFSRYEVPAEGGHCRLVEEHTLREVLKEDFAPKLFSPETVDSSTKEYLAPKKRTLAKSRDLATLSSEMRSESSESSAARSALRTKQTAFQRPQPHESDSSFVDYTDDSGVDDGADTDLPDLSSLRAKEVASVCSSAEVSECSSTRVPVAARSRGLEAKQQSSTGELPHSSVSTSSSEHMSSTGGLAQDQCDGRSLQRAQRKPGVTHVLRDDGSVVVDEAAAVGSGDGGGLLSPQSADRSGFDLGPEIHRAKISEPSSALIATDEMREEFGSGTVLGLLETIDSQTHRVDSENDSDLQSLSGSSSVVEELGCDSAPDGDSSPLIPPSTLSDDNDSDSLLLA